MFTPREQFSEKHVVIPDIHGEYKVAEKVIDHYYDDADVGFVFLGDLVDRKGIEVDHDRGVYKTLELVRRLGDRAVVTMAHHEWILLNAMMNATDYLQDYAGQTWLGLASQHGYESNVLIAYGLDPAIRHACQTPKKLRKRLARAGHLEVLLNMVPYYETQTFIATHAGMQHRVSLEQQKQALEDLAKLMAIGVFFELPPQWSSHMLATDPSPVMSTDKAIISGHSHSLQTTARRPRNRVSDRSLHGGQRIRLASTLNAPWSEPLHIYEDWTKTIVLFDQDNKGNPDEDSPDRANVS